jgi:hypothetical protein
MRAIYDATVTAVINAPSELVREVGAVLARQKGEGGAADQLKASAEQAKAHSPGDPQAFFLGQVTRAAALVGQKAPADAPAYKAWLVACAEKTAQAAKEGGFFGFGGVQVTPGETAAIARLTSALDAAGAAPAPAPPATPAAPADAPPAPTGPPTSPGGTASTEGKSG